MRKVIALVFIISLVACNSLTQVAGNGRIVDTLGQHGLPDLSVIIKELLESSGVRASDKLSLQGAYLDSSLYKITIPTELVSITSMMRLFGMGERVDKVERLMNRAAEQAAREAGSVFVKAVRQMSIDDALGLIQGSETAATDYFRQTTYTALERRYRPIIEKNLQQIGFYGEYKQFLNAYKALPIISKPDIDLENYVLTKSLDSLFLQMAEEERAIRKDPVGQGNHLLEKVLTKSY